MQMKLLGLSGGLSQQTIITIVKALVFAYISDYSITIEVLCISEYDIRYCDGSDPTKYEGDTQYVIENIIEADALFIGTPMYRGSYTGMLKNMFDILPNDALLGKPVGLIATGGSDHHYLALEQELRPLLSFFYAFGVPGCVYANNNHFSERDLICNETLDRLKQLAKAVVNLERILPTDKTNIIGPMGPSLYKQKHLAPRLKIVR